MLRLLTLSLVVCAVPAGHASERQAREVPQVHCSKGQYRFDPQLYRCLEVIVFEIRNGKRVPRVYHVWEKRRGSR